MMAADHIIDVNEMNFEYEVVEYSKNTPVLVDFWAEWCQPCKILGPMLESITSEASVQIRLAKVNIDQNPNLAIKFGVRSIPTVKAFISGQIASEFVGVLPERNIREFIAKLALPSLAKLDEEKGLNLLLDHNWQDAETVFRKTLEHNTDSSTARLGLAKALLAQNHPRDALDELDAVVSGKEMSQVKILRPYAETLANLHDGNLLINKELDAVLVNSMKLAGQGKFSIALDGLLDILRMDKNYQDGLIRGIVLAILELKGSEDPETREYRSELAAILF
jgi:putative thioredoxin